MERDEVLQVLRDKGEERLGLPTDAAEGTSFVRDLAVDSLAVVEYVMDLEDAFGIELPEERVSTADTLGELADVVVGSLDTALNRDG